MQCKLFLKIKNLKAQNVMAKKRERESLHGQLLLNFQEILIDKTLFLKMSEVKRTGLKPLRSSTNIINNKSFNSLKRVTSTEKHLRPKISSTETELKSIKTPINNDSTNRQSLKKSINKLIINKQIKKNSQSVEKKKVKKAIKTILNKDQRIKKWLITKEQINDADYWHLHSERLSKELNEILVELDELEFENELLVAEYEEMAKLAKNAFKLNKLFKMIGRSNLLVGEQDDQD